MRTVVDRVAVTPDEAIALYMRWRDSLDGAAERRRAESAARKKEAADQKYLRELRALAGED